MDGWNAQPHQYRTFYHGIDRPWCSTQRVFGWCICGADEIDEWKTESGMTLVGMCASASHDGITWSKADIWLVRLHEREPIEERGEWW